MPEVDEAPLPLTVAEAVQAERVGRRLRYLFFWNDRPTRGDGPGPGCLSQWWVAPFTESGVLFRSAEHYMMAHKAWMFGDDSTARKVLAADHPGEAKSLGRMVRGFDEASWQQRRSDIVVRGSIAKFGQHEDLRAFLLGTRRRLLVEASPRDAVWGIGLAANDERAASPQQWRGLNLLGFALMAARDAVAKPR